jgi:hypothetical protein
LMILFISSREMKSLVIIRIAMKFYYPLRRPIQRNIKRRGRLNKAECSNDFELKRLCYIVLGSKEKQVHLYHFGTKYDAVLVTMNYLNQ